MVTRNKAVLSFPAKTLLARRPSGERELPNLPNLMQPNEKLELLTHLAITRWYPLFPPVQYQRRTAKAHDLNNK